MVTVSGTTDCSWDVKIVENQKIVQYMWEQIRGKADGWPVHGYMNPNLKQIVIHDVKDFAHEWKHAYCHSYYFYHLGYNHQTICEPFPHFKIQL